MAVPTYAPILDSEIQPGDSALASVFIRLRNNQLAAMNVDSDDTDPQPVAPYDFAVDSDDYAKVTGGTAALPPRTIWDSANPTHLAKVDTRHQFFGGGDSPYVVCRITPHVSPGVGVIGARAFGYANGDGATPTTPFPVTPSGYRNAEYGAVDLPIGETLVATFVNAYYTFRAYFSVTYSGGLLKVGMRIDGAGAYCLMTSEFYKLHRRA